MRPLTHRVWEQHYVDLREPIRSRFPQVDEWELARVNDDYDALLELLQRSTGMDADRVLDQVTSLDVEELGIGTGGAGQEDGDDGASLDRLSLGKGFTEAERPRIVDRLSQLNRHLKRFRADGTYLELSVKDRETPSQVVTLEAEVPGFSRFVVKSNEHDLRAALADVRDDLIKQISREVDKRTRGAK
jgi:ribosome-associated translation inhibitor RaiA